MVSEQEEILTVFKRCLESALIEHNLEKSLSTMAEDVIGIGMGAQGVVCCKADAARIVGDSKEDSGDTKTVMSYSDVQIRCFEGRFASICAIVKVTVTGAKNPVTSTLGQMMSLRKVEGQWEIVSLQANPLFNEIEELEAYPIRFAENLLETYRQQERIAKNAQNDSIAIYLVDFTKGIFETSIIKSDLVIRTQKGDPYEKVMFDTARSRLSDEDFYTFISTFSLGNIMRAFQEGRMELSAEYEMHIASKRSVWLRTLMKLYVDKADGNLKGYLYVIDIDVIKRRELELQQRTERDDMTGLYNKNYAGIRVGEQLENISPTNKGAFFMIDLDCFKTINDTYGHREGDRVIKETANCIMALTRKGDVGGRLGGDEFCMYLQGELTHAVVRGRAELLCANIRSLIPLAENGTSCSIGIVMCTEPGLTFETVYQKADTALYQQKRAGRNGYTFFAEPPRE